MIEKNIDFLVLGCSHYPYLLPQIKKIIPAKITIIDSGEAVAKQTQNILEQNSLINSSKNKSSQLFYTNSEPEVLKSILDDKEKVIYKNF
jgi:glutamate racemase